MRKDSGVEGAELGGAMMDVGRGHGELRGGKERRRAWSEESSFADHEVIVAGSCRTGRLRGARPLRGGYTGLGEVSAGGLALLGAECTTLVLIIGD